MIDGHGHVREGRRASRPFGPGDVIFVEAGAVHRFEAYGDDFATWVVFWGPEGGEAGALEARARRGGSAGHHAALAHSGWSTGSSTGTG